MDIKSPPLKLFLSIILFFVLRCWILNWETYLSDIGLFHHVSMKAVWENVPVYGKSPFVYPWITWLFIKWPASLSSHMSLQTYTFLIHSASFALELSIIFYLAHLAKKEVLDINNVSFSIAIYSVLSTFMGHLLYDRTDFLMMLCLFGIYAWWTNKKRKLWYGATYLGFAIKLLPIGFSFFKLAEERRLTKNSLYLIVFLIASVVSFSLIDTYYLPGMIQAVTTHANRGIQIESLWSMPFLLAKAFQIAPEIKIISANGAQEISSELIPAWFMIGSKYCGFIFMTLLWLHFLWRRVNLTSLDLRCLFFLVIILSFLALQRVLSTQFLIWPLPFLSIWIARKKDLAAAALSIGIYILTYIGFTHYWDLVAADPLISSILFTRNLLIVILFGYFLRLFLKQTKMSVNSTTNAQP